MPPLPPLTAAGAEADAMLAAGAAAAAAPPLLRSPNPPPLSPTSAAPRKGLGACVEADSAVSAGGGVAAISSAAHAEASASWKRSTRSSQVAMASASCACCRDPRLPSTRCCTRLKASTGRPATSGSTGVGDARAVVGLCDEDEEEEEDDDEEDDGFCCLLPLLEVRL